MEDQLEDYKYNNSFWMKSEQLYAHFNNNFNEFTSMASVFENFSKSCAFFNEQINNSLNKIKLLSDEESTRYKGIQVLFHFIRQFTESLCNLGKKAETLSKKIYDKKEVHSSIQSSVELCKENHYNYKKATQKLAELKNNYFHSIDKAIELHLKGKDKKINKNEIQKCKEVYKTEIKEVEKNRVEYMTVQGHIFEGIEVFEKECTNELREYFEDFVKLFDNFKKEISINETDLEMIKQISGDIDSKVFAENNKSLQTGPRRNQYLEYSTDLERYFDNFEDLKKKVKNKTSLERRKIINEIGQKVDSFLKGIIKEEPDEINRKIETIAKKIKDNCCTEKEYQYIEEKFLMSYEKFKRWKSDVIKDQDFQKVGVEWDERFIYMKTFLGYFNKTRMQSKELDQENFTFLCRAINLILSLNDNKDVDFGLCDLLVILSSTFYMVDPEDKNRKIYLFEKTRDANIMQTQGFWIGLTKFELNEEIQHQNTEEQTLDENNISIEKISNSVSAKIMSLCYNIIQYVKNSEKLNQIIYDVFKYCKLDKNNRQNIIEMLETQIQAENIEVKLDKEYLIGNM